MLSLLQQIYVAGFVADGLSQTDAEELVRKLWPKIEVVSRNDTEAIYLVTPSAFANVASCCIGADVNARFHVGRRAVVQSAVLINVCCVVIGDFAGGVLLGISPDVTFESALKVGEAAKIIARKHSWDDEQRVTELTGYVPSGKLLFSPRLITTRTPRK